MPEHKIVTLTNEQIPTILSYDIGSESYVIGNQARQTGLKGKTSVFNFKPDIGEGDKSFSQDKTRYWIAPTARYDKNTRTLTAKEATIRFLQELLRDVKTPKEMIIGEPARREQAWKDNFRKHMREVCKEGLGLAPQFFPEPFAVFQYYRQVEGIIPNTGSATVLILDIGGGTFNSCIISTTEEGYLSRGGAKAVPLGLQAELCGGSLIDKELLTLLVKKAQNKGVQFKDDPIKRAELSEIPVLLHIEDAKIALSKMIGPDARVSDSFSSVRTSIRLERGILHPEQEIKAELTGDDLKEVLRKVWRRTWGPIIIRTINEAREKVSFDRLDRVLVAGGSSRLPFMKEEIATVLPSLVRPENIILGSDAGNAVALGIAYECREQARKYPQLSVGKMAYCVLNDLYIGFRRSRRDPIVLPKVRSARGLSRVGQLLSSPFETKELTVKYTVEIPFEVRDRVFYYFNDQPFDVQSSGTESTALNCLNLNDDVFSVSSHTALTNKCGLQIDIQKNGMIKPIFSLHEKGKEGKVHEIGCPEFFIDNLRVKDGDEFLGLDFGTSNSYVVRFLSPAEEIVSADYPQFRVNEDVMEELRRLEEDISLRRSMGLFNDEMIFKSARESTLLMVFHSNKIEGNPLTKGETEAALRKGRVGDMSEKEQEALNLEDAYKWMISNLEFMEEDPESFVRHINQMILKNIKEGGGQYRKGNVSLAGMDFVPPIGASVPGFMQQYGTELKKGPEWRSVLEFATTMHTKFVSIHPFVDANGRTARLLMNAILLLNKLPVLVINFDDKQRYLDSLSECNNGDVSALISFMIECYRPQIEELGNDLKRIDLQRPIRPSRVAENTVDPIKAAMQEVGWTTSKNPLELVMEDKIRELNSLKQVEYQEWERAFSMLLLDAKSMSDTFNASYEKDGFSMQVLQYDMLSFEKYFDIQRAKNVPRTWFFRLDVLGPGSYVRMMLFFEHISTDCVMTGTVNQVALKVARYNGSKYVRLTSEPITLRVIAFDDGQLIFIGPDGNKIEGRADFVLQCFAAELIKAYVTIK